MLQQTRVAAVLEHYARFMQRFPTLSDLAEASEDEVVAQWSGLGYYRRARMLHRAARFVMEQLGGRLPETAAGLRALPGVGEYTCAAIASIGFGEAVACVDGNVERVVRRLCGWDEGSGTAAKVRAEAARLLDGKRPGDFNQAMMELGAVVCLPRGPLCVECRVREMCATQGEHSVAGRKKMLSREEAYALLRRMPGSPPAEVLLEQRAADASLMAGMWELPGIEASDAGRGTKVLTLRHSITTTNYYVSVYEMAAAEERRLPKRKAVRKWFGVDELHRLALTGLARKTLKRLKLWPAYNEAGAVVAFDEAEGESLL